MSHMRMVRGLALAGLVAAFAAGSAFAQGGGGGGGGGRGGFNPAAMRQRMEDRIKTDLAVTDEEWKAIQPLVDNVLTLQTQAAMGRFGRGRRGGGGGAPAGGELSPVQQANQDLASVLENKDSTAADITPKLKAFRDAKAKAQADLVAAQAALKQVLTARQEAQLVQMGLLD